MEIIKYGTVFFSSMFKFLVGPLLGYQLELSFFESFFLTNLGMMAGVILFTYLGRQIKYYVINRFFRSRRLFTPRNRRIVKIWRKYGIIGIAFLTPIFLSPPVGTLIATSFGENREKILLHMFLSSIFWSGIIVAIIYLFGNISQV